MYVSQKFINQLSPTTLLSWRPTTMNLLVKVMQQTKNWHFRSTPSLSIFIDPQIHRWNRTLMLSRRCLFGLSLSAKQLQLAIAYLWRWWAKRSIHKKYKCVLILFYWISCTKSKQTNLQTYKSPVHVFTFTYLLCHVRFKAGFKQSKSQCHLHWLIRTVPLRANWYKLRYTHCSNLRNISFRFRSRSRIHAWKQVSVRCTNYLWLIPCGPMYTAVLWYTLKL